GILHAHDKASCGLSDPPFRFRKCFFTIHASFSTPSNSEEALNCYLEWSYDFERSRRDASWHGSRASAERVALQSSVTRRHMRKPGQGLTEKKSKRYQSFCLGMAPAIGRGCNS